MREYGKTIEKLLEVVEEKNPHTALSKAIDIYENYPEHEEEVPIKYDENTGEPLEMKWVPRENSKGLRALLDYEENNDRYVSLKWPDEKFGEPEYTHIKFNQNVVDYLFEELDIKNNPIVINANGNNYIVGYNERTVSVGGHNDVSKAKEREIYFERFNYMLTPNGESKIDLSS